MDLIKNLNTSFSELSVSTPALHPANSLPTNTTNTTNPTAHDKAVGSTALKGVVVSGAKSTAVVFSPAQPGGAQFSGRGKSSRPPDCGNSSGPPSSSSAMQNKTVRVRREEIAGTPSKRKRTSESSPNEPSSKKVMKKKEPKGPTTTGPVPSTSSFSDAAKLNLRAVIRVAGGGQMDQSVVQELLKVLYLRLDAVPAGTARPIFERNFLFKGVFFVECANEASIEWLLNVVRDVGSVNGNALMVSSADKEEVRRVVAFTTSDPDSATSSTMLKRLMDSNFGLDVSQWVYLKRLNVSTKGVTHLVAVDEDSLSYIKTKGKRLYYMMQSVYVDIRGPYHMLRPSVSQPPPTKKRASKRKRASEKAGGSTQSGPNPKK